MCHGRNYLLQLCVLQVVAHHELEHLGQESMIFWFGIRGTDLEQLAVADVAVFVHIVDLKGN